MDVKDWRTRRGNRKSVYERARMKVQQAVEGLPLEVQTVLLMHVCDGVERKIKAAKAVSEPA